MAERTDAKNTKKVGGQGRKSFLHTKSAGTK